ncbi:mannose-1-phosphate guanylyltransferase/mannose-6-phosphate isomerase [Desulforegula conservatrix]|uniref:mannose-1-phosphate guanylyltransferase/mannose-6-phosphate isomerase n=1 Tax=Desulforegula conservatrix TaxID=153026 RepID=UPI0004073D72|nr:mannose-1-phosphate guanylyltransferase/mannose-6-phosphate isomerase [Desulforegula conservatrix]
MIISVILAGGSGTRLWPLSRELYPKQLINLVNEDTMLQNTLTRLNGVEKKGSPIIICNEDHRFMVAEQIRQIGTQTPTIILEPAGRNTAPAVAVAAFHAFRSDHDAVLLVMPADHHIENSEAFAKAMNTAAKIATNNVMITFGIVPESPETGYGYIKKGKACCSDDINEKTEAFLIDSFVEKPDLETAKKYVESGEYYWNSGMFMFRAGTYIEELSKYAPEMIKQCETAVKLGKADLDFFRLDAEAFKACPSDSIDYAVMEKTDRGVMIPLKAGWNDLGSWQSLWQTGKKDCNMNVLHGDTLLHDVKNSYIHASERMVAAIGLENHIIVETSDAVLVSPMDRSQDIKHLVSKLKSSKRSEATIHRKVYRPWGAYESIDFADRFQVKRITVKPGGVLSLQKHYHRAEHWIVVHGTALVTKDNESFLLKEDESTYLPLGVTHRLENPGRIPLELIEVQTGPYLGEDDIARFEDVYGRTK